MARHAQDEWDIASSVGLTALGVAAGRAIESSRSDALVVDPYAETLVSAAQPEVSMPTRIPDSDDRQNEPVHELWSQLATHMAVRTLFFDEFFSAAWDEGVRQVVLLASGLDARPWRLPWPAESTVFEIDQPRVLSFKETVLARHQAEPRCGHRNVPIDLRHDWRSALEQAGFDPSRPTAWLAEGLLPYLPDEAEAGLLSTIGELSAPGSRIAVEHAHSLQTLLDDDDGRFAAVADQLGVDITELVYDNATRPAPDEWLAARGWQPTVTAGDKLAATYGRTLGGMPLRVAEQQRYITAGLPE